MVLRLTHAGDRESGEVSYYLSSLPPQAKPNLRTLFDLLRRPSIRLVLAAILISISGHFAGFTYVRPYLEQVPALSIEVISLVLLAYGVGGTAAGAVLDEVFAVSELARIVVLPGVSANPAFVTYAEAGKPPSVSASAALSA